jgi:hypothetical protein
MRVLLKKVGLYLYLAVTVMAVGADAFFNIMH